MRAHAKRVSGVFRDELGRLYNGTAEDAVFAIADDLRMKQRHRSPRLDPRPIAVALGVSIERGDIPGSGVLAGWSTSQPRIVLPAIRTDRAGRQRENFTIAHELGHFLLRSRLEGAVTATALDSGHPEEEHLCNLFAAELLVPRTFFLKTIRKHGLTPSALFWMSEVCDVTLRVIARRIASVYGEKFLAVKWQKRGSVIESCWAEPRLEGVLELPRTGRSTIERVFAGPGLHGGADVLICGARRVRWLCVSERIGFSPSALTLGLRSGTDLTLKSLSPLPDARALVSPQLALF